jgi:hypothetical protein
MPGKKYRSIKNPKLYEKMKDSGMSKGKAARLSNWMTKKGKGKRKKK